MVYVCLEDQYNNMQGYELGYQYRDNFLSGMNFDTYDATWQGNTDGNRTIEEVMNTLYKTNYSDVVIAGVEIFPIEESIHTRTEYIMPHGYCLVLNQTKDFKYLTVQNIERVKVVLVDPYSANGVVMKEGAAITYGPTPYYDEHEYFIYNAHFNIHDQACEKKLNLYLIFKKMLCRTLNINQDNSHMNIHTGT